VVNDKPEQDAVKITGGLLDQLAVFDPPQIPEPPTQ